MYKVIFNVKSTPGYYNITLVSSDQSHFINIYICVIDKHVSVTISKSKDGSYFKSPCKESSDLQLGSNNTIEETFNIVKDYFINKGYKLSTY
jgi:hypothetical protein